MSETLQSKLTTAMISLTILMLAAGVAFWREASITLTKLEQIQIASSRELNGLVKRLNDLEAENRRQWAAVQADIVQLKYSGRKAGNE